MGTGSDVGGLKIAGSRPRRCHRGPLPERGGACGLGGGTGSLLEPELRVRLLTASTACSSAAAAARTGVRVLEFLGRSTMQRGFLLPLGPFLPYMLLLRRR